MKTVKTGWDGISVEFTVEKRVYFNEVRARGSQAIRVKMKPYNVVARMYPKIFYVPKVVAEDIMEMTGMFRIRMLKGRKRYPWRKNRRYSLF